MNWAKELIELSEQHGGDMLHPEVVKYGHYLWQKADESRCSYARFTDRFFSAL